MPTTDFHQSSSSPPSSFSHGFGFSILSRRRDQVHSMSDSSNGGKDSEIDAFQKHVSDQFHDLSAAADSGELLSIPWIRRLLDAFLCIQEEFKVILFNYNNASNTTKSPLVEKYVAEYFDRSVKALDVCNAIRDGIEQVRQWRNQLEIVLCALEGGKQRSSGSVGEGQFRRAKKALVDLAIGMLEEKHTSVSSSSHRNRSFGRNKESSSSNKSVGHYRSLSWSVSRTWSAAKQLQAISSNLVAPKANEIASTNGLNVAIFTMNYVLLFVMWALVAAIPCQDRGLQTHFYVTKQFYWAVPILSLHERILEESKKRDRRNACGLLREIHEIEKCARVMNELTDSVQFPLTEEREREVRQRVKEVGVVYESLKGELDPLERQVREVFHRIVRSRTEGLESVGSTSR